jgi:Domain of unknown function (DUF4234)
MIRRSIVAVILLSLVTFGIYSLVWLIKTKNEMKASGATDIPTGWLLLIPIVNVYWMWKYAGGVEQISGGKTSQAMAFILLFVLGVIGFAILQDGFNKLADVGQRPLEVRAAG